MSEKVIVNEVGPRDGLQNQAVLVPASDKLALIGSLVDAGLRHIEATSFVSPKAVPQMADADEVFRNLPNEDRVEYAALVLNEKGYERAVDAGAKVLAVALSATETMSRKNNNKSLGESRALYGGLMRRARDEGFRGTAHISVALGCPYEGDVAPELVCELAEEMLEKGAHLVVIADTIGSGNPSQVDRLFGLLGRRTDMSLVAGHFHDTRALALANTWAALQQGVRRFDSSVGGLGGCPFAPGAAGNVATEDLVTMLHQCGFETGIDVTKLLSTVSAVEKMVKRSLGGRMVPWIESQQTVGGNSRVGS